MDHRPVSRYAILSVLALSVAVSTAACSAEPASPLPVDAQAQTVSPSVPASRTPAPEGTTAEALEPVETTVAVRTTRPRTGNAPGKPPTTTASGAPSTCLGAVRYDLDSQSVEAATMRSMCVRVGAVLRLQNLGPGELTAEPASLVRPRYEAGVHDTQFVGTGTVSLRFLQGDDEVEITVVIRQ